MNKKELANRLNEVYRHLYANHGISSQSLNGSWENPKTGNW